MVLDPVQLITFAVTARHGSVSLAARELSRSQPAVSLQLKNLTAAAGEPLYRRHRQGITLTPAGEALLPHARALERALAGARRAVVELQGVELGQLGVAASMTVAVYLLPFALARFRERHAGVALRLLTRNSEEVLALLARGDTEIGFIETALDTVPPGLEAHVYYRDEVVLAVKPDHPFAGVPELPATSLEGTAVVTRERGSGTRRTAEHALLELGVRLGTALEASGIEAEKEAILQGLGPGFISALAIRRELAAGLLKTVRVKDLDLARNMTLLHPPKEQCSAAARAFLTFLDAPGALPQVMA